MASHQRDPAGQNHRRKRLITVTATPQGEPRATAARDEPPATVADAGADDRPAHGGRANPRRARSHAYHVTPSRVPPASPPRHGTNPAPAWICLRLGSGRKRPSPHIGSHRAPRGAAAPCPHTEVVIELDRRRRHGFRRSRVDSRCPRTRGAIRTARTLKPTARAADVAADNDSIPSLNGDRVSKKDLTMAPGADARIAAAMTLGVTQRVLRTTPLCLARSKADRRGSYRPLRSGHTPNSATTSPSPAARTRCHVRATRTSALVLSHPRSRPEIAPAIRRSPSRPPTVRDGLARVRHLAVTPVRRLESELRGVRTRESATSADVPIDASADQNDSERVRKTIEYALTTDRFRRPSPATRRSRAPAIEAPRKPTAAADRTPKRSRSRALRIRTLERYARLVPTDYWNGP